MKAPEGFCFAFSQNDEIRIFFGPCLPRNYETSIPNFTHYLFSYHEQCSAFYSSSLSLATP